LLASSISSHNLNDIDKVDKIERKNDRIRDVTDSIETESSVRFSVKSYFFT